MSPQQLAIALILTGCGLSMPAVSRAALTIPGADGSDGAVSVTGAQETRIVDLALAKTGHWDDPGDGNGNGVYDPQMWAVVFKYSSVNATGYYGQRIKFINHPKGAPVVWLVSGNVTISSGVVVDLDGANQKTGQHAIPGPGGYWGGINPISTSLLTGAGFGPGGGLKNDAQNAYGGSGSYASSGNYLAGPIYGNLRILPLIGGSGGAGSTAGYGGSAGGGAILIAATGTVRIDGAIYARGGSGENGWRSGLGSAGAVRIVADTITGTGVIDVRGRPGNNAPTAGGDGRIRLEAKNFGGSLTTLPISYGFAPDEPVLLWPPDTAPTIAVVSIGGVAAPADPFGNINAGYTDVPLADLSTGNIVLASHYVDPAATVEVRIVPKYGDPIIIPQATFTSGDLTAATWTVTNAAFPKGIFTVQAHAVNP